MGEIVQSIWFYITNSGTLSAFFLMLWTLAIKFILISVYFSLLYGVIVCLKKRLHKKISVRMGYYCWYTLLFSVVLANLGVNNYFTAQSYRLLHATNLYMEAAFLVGCVLSVAWIIVVFCKLTTLFLLNRKIIKSMRHMERYDDNERLAQRAAEVLGLRNMPNVLIADYIDTPVSYGVFKNTILLPFNFEEKYSADELYLLLLHETVHIKNGDTAKLHIVSLIGCFLWLAPAIRLFEKSFKRDSEILCDNRVIGINGERDIYGSLILKECVNRNARLGFGFSDSYHALENRLDALYSYKGEAGAHLKLFAIIPAAALMICVFSYALRADWLIVNDTYNSAFEIAVFDAESGEYVSLPPEDCARVYKIEDGKIIFNTEALLVLTQSFADNGQILVNIVSDNYVVQMGETALSSGLNSGVGLAAEEQALVMDYAERLQPRTFAEYLFLLITSKL